MKLSHLLAILPVLLLIFSSEYSHGEEKMLVKISSKDLIELKKGLVSSKYGQEDLSLGDWKKIVVPVRVNVPDIHEHALQYVEDLEVIQEGDGEWCCNGVEIFKSGCKSGQTDIGLHEGVKCWRSTDDNADFDLCEQCI